MIDRILPSWDAQAWLQDFETSKRIQNGTCSSRSKVFQSTLEIVSKGGYTTSSGVKIELDSLYNKNALRDNVFCERELRLINQEHIYPTVIKVVKQDCLAYAKSLLEEDGTRDLCVLNMASAKNPGGGVFGGAGAQEEYLFRCSDYFRFLYQYASLTSFDCKKVYGIPHNPRHSYPLNKNFGGVFSRGVTIFRDTEAKGYALLEDPWQVNFVAVAANCIRGFVRAGDKLIPDRFIPSTLNQIRTILRLAYYNGQRRLVLGAFGCGAFANPPQHMAILFKQVIDEPEFHCIFREIHFAIIEDHNSRGMNFEVFKSVLGSLPAQITDQQRIESLLRSTGRKGIERVIEELSEGGFYTVPASVAYHHNNVGGLARHSLAVYEEAYKKYLQQRSSIHVIHLDENSVVLCSLLHDVCKMDEYVIKRGRPHHTANYKKEIHGLKSVKLLTDWGLVLTDEEKAAISWHMGNFAKDAESFYGYNYEVASTKSLFVKLIHEADHVGSRLTRN